MTAPIILTAYSAGSDAMKTWAVVEKAVKKAFPDHPVYFAFTSGRTLKKAEKEGNDDICSVYRQMEYLTRKGYDELIVQPLLTACGGEFHKILIQALNFSNENDDVTVNISMPLLCSPEDYILTAAALENEINRIRDGAVIVIGHGMKHPAWTTYAALDYALKKRFGNRVFAGVIEEGFPVKEDILKEIAAKGFSKVRLIPFLMTGGYHLTRDINGDGENSWKSSFEKKGISVTVARSVLGTNPGVMDIFIRHIRNSGNFPENH